MSLTGWTEERVETLKALYAEGLSFGQIAEQMGDGLTRNAVLGKAKRLKLAARSVVRTPVQKLARQRQSAEGRAVGGLASGQQRAAARARQAQRQPKLVPAPELPRHVYDLARIDLMALNEHTCKWPVGDPLLPGFGFCGLSTRAGSSYCDDHHGRAWHPPRPRVAVKGLAGVA